MADRLAAAKSFRLAFRTKHKKWNGCKIQTSRLDNTRTMYINYVDWNMKTRNDHESKVDLAKIWL